ncbi:MAG: HEAT repeat domain-containing protein [Kofleriaceae bacterium]|nr:HEAT repeat domain-containing protein [Kofleriaceae bacterium]
MWKRSAALVVLLAACSSSTDEPVAAPAPLVVSSSTPPPQVHADWRARVTAEVLAVRTSSPAHYEELRRAAPQKTRARTLRFTTDVIHDPRAAAVFLERLVENVDTAEVRAAIVEALPRTGGLYADALADLMVHETSAEVRTAYVFAARRAPGDLAIGVLARGLSDEASIVRAEAARSAAAHPDGARLANELRAALASPDPQLRTEAARALGVLRVTGAQAELTARLTDASPEVRLEALRALDRIAPGTLAGRPALDTLASDPDPRVARLASKLAGRASTIAP